MTFVIAQMSDIHIGGKGPGSGERFSQAIDEVNAMSRRPDLVLLTGDVTDHGTAAEWDELLVRLHELTVPWEAIAGNHDRDIAHLTGHRAIDTGPLRLVLLDTSSDVFTADDAEWLDAELSASDGPTIVAVHQPPFETGIWWMDCVGLKGADLMETVVRRHPHVLKVLSGHAHRLIQSNWAACSLWVSPSTAVSVAVDFDPAHEPAETEEPPSFSLHAYTSSGIVSHVVPVGDTARRRLIVDESGDFVAGLRSVQAARDTDFA